jgi:hypothetical protein
MLNDSINSYRSFWPSCEIFSGVWFEPPIRPEKFRPRNWRSSFFWPISSTGNVLTLDWFFLAEIVYSDFQHFYLRKWGLLKIWDWRKERQKKGFWIGRINSQFILHCCEPFTKSICRIIVFLDFINLFVWTVLPLVT